MWWKSHIPLNQRRTLSINRDYQLIVANKVTNSPPSTVTTNSLLETKLQIRSTNSNYQLVAANETTETFQPTATINLLPPTKLQTRFHQQQKSSPPPKLLIFFRQQQLSTPLIAADKTTKWSLHTMDWKVGTTTATMNHSCHRSITTQTWLIVWGQERSPLGLLCPRCCYVVAVELHAAFIVNTGIDGRLSPLLPATLVCWW